MRPELLNALTLAYLGDAVFEVYVREYLILECGIVKPDDLQKASVQFVSANAQAAFMKVALKEQYLSEEEIAIYKRGRNTKGHGVKNKRVIDHNRSSGFEALIGHLYMLHQTERIEEIFNLYKKHVNLQKANDEETK